MAVVRPATARAVVFHGPDDLRLEDVPLPPLRSGEMLVRIRACGLCPGEVMDWYLARKAPVPLGHEPVAEVVEVADGVAFQPGDRVFVHHHASCLVCRACRRGDHVHCATWRPRRLIPGCLATYAVAQAPAVAADTVRLPDALDDDTATFVEPLACVAKSIRRARLRGEDRVLVIGLGVMGLLHLMALRRAAGPPLLIGADRVPARVAAAAPFADVVIDTARKPLREAVGRATGGDGADVAIVGPGSVEALEAGLECVAPGGTLVVFTPTPPDAAWPLRPHDLFFKEIAIVPSYSAGPDDTREGLRLLAEGLPVARLITHRLPLEDAARGYALIRAAGPALKVVVHP
ncbi:MAG: alcohol dehydrogenase catalytic domain-containing protein [Armatimonadetes bacterium]|nr:alcohol dehydrogenase catalytic domain-containing protein [Armatimonadota bacterium]